MLMAFGTNYGFRRTIPHMLGVAIGFTLMVLLVGLGLMRLFDAYPVSYLILKVASVCYLIFLAWKIATAASIEGGEIRAESGAKPFTFMQAAMFQWVNPKAWAMALTAVSVYTPQPHSIVNVITVAMIFGSINLPSVSIWAFMGTQLRKFLTNSRRLRIFNMVAAVLLLGSLYPILFSG